MNHKGEGLRGRACSQKFHIPGFRGSRVLLGVLMQSYVLCVIMSLNLKGFKVKVLQEA